MTAYADQLIQIAAILDSELVDGDVRVSLGDEQTETGFGARAPYWGLDGFISMPNAKDANGCAEALYVQDGLAKRVIASRDGRFINKIGKGFSSGDRAIVSNCDARVVVKPARNGVTLYTVNEKDNGHAMSIDLAGQDGELRILNGKAQIKITTDEITMGVSGGASISIKGGKVQITATSISLNGSTVTLGIMPGGVAPPPGTNSAITGTSGMTGIPSSSVTIAP